MTDLPQIHDWFQGLLTPGQWIFLWIAAFILIAISGLISSLSEDDADLFGISLYVGTLIPPLIWVVLIALGHFISFMIFLWFGNSR